MTTYYVDATGGSDAAAGTSTGTAWQTLTKIYNEFGLSTFSGGDSILFKRDETWTATASARLRVRNVTGAALDNELYIGAYDTGARPKIDGLGAMGSVILGGYDDVQHYVIVEDLEITGTTAQIVHFLGVHDWTLRNLRLGYTTTGSSVMYRDSCYDILVENCDVYGGDSTLSPMYVGNASDATDRPHDITIRNCYINESDNECIDIKPGCYDILVEKCTLSNALGSGIDVRGTDNIVRDCKIICPSGSWGIAGWFALGYGTGHTLEGNLIVGPDEGIRLEGTGHTINNNTIADCTSYGIRMTGDAGTTLKNNILYDTGIGIYASSTLPGSSDYNCFNSNGTSDWYWSGANRTVAVMCSSYSRECNSITSGPSFIDDVDYEIYDTSPCYGAGESGAVIGYFDPDVDGRVYKSDVWLRALWLMEEVSGNRADDTANDNELTDNNTVSSSTDAKEGTRSADFETGNSEYLDITDSAQILLNIKENFSFCAWIKPESISALRMIASKYNSSGSQVSWAFYIRSSNELKAEISSTGSTSTTAATALSTVSAATWYHVTLVYNLSDIRIYFDGSLDSNGADNPKTYSSNIFDSTAPVRIGAYSGGSYYDGLMDEVAIFNRPLTAFEIEDIYNNGIRGEIPPKAYYYRRRTT